MGTRWPIGDQAERRSDNLDFNRARLGRLQPVAPGRLRQNAGRRRHGFAGQATGKPAGADRERSRLCPHRRFRRADQGRQGFQPALGKPGDRRARLGDAAVASLFRGRRPHLPGFPGELRQRPRRKLAAGRRLQGQPWPMGNPHDQALDARIRHKRFFKQPRGSCKNATGSPDEAKADELP